MVEQTPLEDLRNSLGSVYELIGQEASSVLPHSESAPEDASSLMIYDLVDFYINSDEGISVRTFLSKSESTLEDW